MTNKQKYKLAKGSHSRFEDGKRVLKDEGDVFVPTDRELEKFPWKFEPVLDKSDEDNTSSGDGTGEDSNTDNGDNTGNEPGDKNNNKSDNNSGEEENNSKNNDDDNKTPDTTDITELSTRDAGPVISECENKEQLKAWLVQEKGDEKPRSTIVSALESRINAVEEGE